MGWDDILKKTLICISLISKDVEYLFKYVLTIHPLKILNSVHFLVAEFVFGVIYVFI